MMRMVRIFGTEVKWRSPWGHLVSTCTSCLLPLSYIGTTIRGESIIPSPHYIYISVCVQDTKSQTSSCPLSLY